MIAINKVGALYLKQMQNFGYNMLILIGFILAPGFAFIFARFIPIPNAAFFGLSMGTLINIVFGGANTMCVLIAEEKEKNTLNVLITSTVSAMDFLLSNALAALTMTVVMNAIIYLICGVYVVPFPMFMLVTTLSGLASIALGAAVGLISKNQLSASSIIIPFVMVFMMIPMFATFMPILKNIGDLLFSQQTINVLNDLANGDFFFGRVSVILANMVVFIVVFVLVYKKVGLEK